MKGITYNLEFKTNNDIIKINNLGMLELINELKRCLLEYYNLDSDLFKINNMMIYNIINKHTRPTNKILKNICTIIKV